MRTSSHNFRPRCPVALVRGGFTLVEMLVVLAIIAILAVLTIPSIVGMLGSMDLKGAASLVGSQLDIARQNASTRNLLTEVRIYQDPNVTDTTAVLPAYRIIAVAIPATAKGGAATDPDEFITAGIGLPGTIIFDQSTAYGPMFASSAVDASGLPLAATEKTSAPFQLQGKKYIKIAYTANGTMNLANNTTTQGTYCLALRDNHAKAISGAPAKNFIAMVLDPTTGRARLYQP